MLECFQEILKHSVALYQVLRSSVVASQEEDFGSGGEKGWGERWDGHHIKAW